MSERQYHVLFISQRNSARSIMAEAILNQVGRGEFLAHSAGVRPSAAVDPIALELLERAKISTTGLRSKHVNEFAGPAAPEMDFVFTLSDTAAGEKLPAWRGQPITAHWRSNDPEHAPDPAEHRLTLIRIRSELERRLRVFINLPLASLDRLSAKRHVDDIGVESEKLADEHGEPPRADEPGKTSRAAASGPRLSR